MPVPCSPYYVSSFPPSIFAEWFSEGVFGTPSPLEPPTNGTEGEPEFTSPLCDGHGLPIVGEKVILASVVGLLRGQRPSAVPGSIRSLVVDTLNRVLRGGTVAHISMERLEGVVPFVADRNPSGSIILEGGLLGIEAAVLHSDPEFILRASCSPVLPVNCAACLSLEAAAGPDITVVKTPGGNNPLTSAVALTNPLALPINLVRK